MRRHAHLGLALLGAALTVPGTARAWQEPAAGPIMGVSHPVPATPAPVPPYVSSMPATATAMPSPGMAATAGVPLDHKHYGRIKSGQVPCEKCEAARKAGRPYMAYPPALPGGVAQAGRQPVTAMTNPTGLPEGSQIVGCAHSSQGVCGPCRKFFEMPGQLTMVSPGAPGAGGGYAVASDAAPGHAVADAADPEPIGVMKTNYSNAGPAGARPPAPQQMMPAGPGSTPFMPQADEHDPHVISHLFGFSAWYRDIKDRMGAKDRRKREAHAAISYDASSDKPTELPASAVFGPSGRPR
jgi:hypothetical protein